jgi:Fe-S cluster biogenesis protein NfuA
MQGFVTVYAEATPNPESLKFVFNKNIIPGGTYDYPNAEAANESPLARQLFQFNFVKGVFIAQNFVTISKVEDALWAELIPILRTFLKEYVQAENPILSPENESRKGELIYDENDSDSVKKIKEILAQSVRPVVEMDGGNIEFKSFDDGVVTLALKGSCSGCPSSTVTLKAGIENLLKRMVPEVKEVVAEAM